MNTLDEIIDAIDYVTSGSMLQAQANVCRATGAVYWAGDGIDDELPDDIEDGSKYVAVRRELGLGKTLAMRFGNDFLPDDVDEIASYFRRRGAYARFKGLLEEKGLLEPWYEYEARRTREAALEWCKAEDVTIRDGRGPGEP